MQHTAFFRHVSASFDGRQSGGQQELPTLCAAMDRLQPATHARVELRVSTPRRVCWSVTWRPGPHDRNSTQEPPAHRTRINEAGDAVPWRQKSLLRRVHNLHPGDTWVSCGEQNSDGS